MFAWWPQVHRWRVLIVWQGTQRKEIVCPVSQIASNIGTRVKLHFADLLSYDCTGVSSIPLHSSHRPYAPPLRHYSPIDHQLTPRSTCSSGVPLRRHRLAGRTDESWVHDWPQMMANLSCHPSPRTMTILYSQGKLRFLKSGAKILYCQQNWNSKSDPFSSCQRVIKLSFV